MKILLSTLFFIALVLTIAARVVDVNFGTGEATTAFTTTAITVICSAGIIASLFIYRTK